jgi:hypothetical protein
MSFDLNTLAKENVTTIHIVHPATDAPLYADEAKTSPVQIIVYGTSSKQYRDKVLAMNNARLKRGKAKPTAEGIESDAIELLVACSKEAINLKLDGEPINTPEAFRKLYSNPSYDWLREQVDNSIGEASNFLQQ